MARDRLAELQLASVGTAPNTGRQVTAARSRDQVHNEPYTRLLDHVTGLAQQLNECQQKIDDVIRGQRDQLIMTSPVDDDVTQRVNELSADVLKQLASLKQQIGQAASQLKSVAGKNDTQLTQTQQCSLQVQLDSLRSRLLSLVQRYNQHQIWFRDRKKELLRRQLKITGVIISDDELDQLVEQSAEVQVFNDGILLQSEAARLSVMQADERLQQLKKVEHSIQQVHELFLQLSMLVEEQTETVDTIEAHVVKSGESARSAVEQLRSAQRKRSLGRKWKLICVVAVCLIVLLLLLVLVWSLT